MSRKPQVGDTVRITGEVVSINSRTAWVGVRASGESSFSVDVSAVEVIQPEEPPIGSVVIKGGEAWTRLDRYEYPDYCWARPQLTGTVYARWVELSDGEVITLGGTA